MSRFARPLLIATLAVALAVPALASEPERTKPSALEGSTLTWCGALERIYAEPEAYRDEPVYIGNPPADGIRRWARSKPGFADLWIDRDNLGWITVAFAERADERRRQLARKFPEIGAVVVEVEHTARELRRLQRRVERDVFPALADAWVSVDPTTNHVHVGVGLLSEETVALLEAGFAGEPLCVDGGDPSDLVADGPQPMSGEGWTLLGHQAGPSDPVYRTGLATDEAQLADLWAEARMAGGPPAVDFDEYVVAWFAAPHGSSCPNLRLDDVLVDRDEGIVHPYIVMPDDPMACTDDLVGAIQFVVAVERERLPPGPFWIQLYPDRAYGDRTVVEVDLTQPGSTALDADIHADDERRPEPLRSDAITEPGYKEWYTFAVSCGIGYLGEINSVHWVTEDSEMPSAWMDKVDEKGQLIVKVLLVDGPDPHAIARTGGRSVRYEPRRTAPPSACRT